MSEVLDIRKILPFLNDRINGPVYVSFITIAELGGTALFVVYALRILFMVRNMVIAEHQELRDRKLNELMESIANLEREAKERKEEKRQKAKENGIEDEIENGESEEIDEQLMDGNEEETKD